MSEEDMKNRYCAVQNMRDRLESDYNTCYNNFRDIMGNDSKVLLYFGMDVDIERCLLLTDTETIITVNTTDVSLNTHHYPKMVNTTQEDIIKTSMILTEITRRLKFLDVTDIECKMMDNTTFTMTFSFKSIKRTLFYYNQKNYKKFCPDANDIIQDKILIVTGLCLPLFLINKHHESYKGYTDLMKMSKHTYFITEKLLFDDDSENFEDEIWEDLTFEKIGVNEI